MCVLLFHNLSPSLLSNSVLEHCTSHLHVTSVMDLKTDKECSLDACNCEMLLYVSEKYKGAGFIVWYQVWGYIIRLYILPPWSLVLLIRAAFQFYGEHEVLRQFRRHEFFVHIVIPVLYQVLIFTWVKWSIWGWSALPKDTISQTMSQDWERILFLWKSCTKWGSKPQRHR